MFENLGDDITSWISKPFELLDNAQSFDKLLIFVLLIVMLLAAIGLSYKFILG